MEIKQMATAIFWDYENVCFAEPDLKLFLDGLNEIYRPNNGSAVRRCFCDWSKVKPGVQNCIIQAGFELIQVPRTRKNASDSQIMINAIQLHNSFSFEDFVLISADGDFNALCRELQTLEVNVSVVARKNISEDLLPHADEVYYVSPRGILFQIEEISREQIAAIVKYAIEDAHKACSSLTSKHPQHAIFSRRDWEFAYDKQTEAKISPFVLKQIIKVEALYGVFVQTYGFALSRNKGYFCPDCRAAEKKELVQIDAFLDLPEKMVLKRPVQNLPPSKLAIFEQKNVKKADPKASKSSSPKQKSKYKEAIVEAFKTMSSNNRKMTSVNLAILNNKACKILNRSPSERLYKSEGYSSFSKCVESVKSQFRKKNVKIKNTTLSWQN